MFTFKKLSLFFLLILTLVLVSACSSTPSSQPAEEKPASNETGKENGTDTEVDEEAGVVNIGYSGPLSGPAAFYGKNTLSGLEMAVEEINANGGFEVSGKKYNLNLVTLDDKYLPNETGANAKRLVQENKTPIIFVPHSGGIFASQVFNIQEKFIIGAYTSEPKVTEQGNALTVRIPPKYSSYIEPFSKYQMERFGKKIAFLPTATQYGKDWASVLEPGWKDLGGEVVYKGSIDFSKDTDFFTIVTNALKEKPDVLFVGGPSEPTALVIKQARELGFKGGFLIMDQAKLDEIEAVLGGTELIEGSVGVLPLVYSKYEGNEKFIEDYSKAHGKNPGSEAGYHYLAAYMFVEAMKAAGSVDDPIAIRAKLEESLANIPADKKIYEIEEIEENGGLVTPLRIAVVEDGKIIDKSLGQ
ncbi:ABC transporter substrate-binding protein [Bacillus pinisoli]|uniref:ABC transporter substrate-binding protein n=1 Tax=Bacillus pinisoli TaxID=2901866 RepID=UPI001FF67067|nr:ABC transporter substrate-binding protein [Bacillus pinisoli]